MGPSKTQGAVSRSQRKAPRKVSVRLWPCGASVRRRLPLGPQPRNGAMLVLIQVSSIKTSLFGSKWPCQDRQRARRRATSARACSSANSVFFKPKSFTPQEGPHDDVRDLHPARRQQILQTVQRQMRRPLQLLHDKGPVWLENRLAVAPNLARRH